MCNDGKKLFLIFVLSLVFFVVTGLKGEAESQSKYPSRAIDIIAPFSPGGGTDLSTRIMAGYLSKKWGVPVNVINKPGGNNIPACLEVYKAAPDGYTLLSDNSSSSSTLGVVVRNVPFNILDRTFIGATCLSPGLLIVPSSSPYKTLREVAAAAKKDPGNFTWTSLGGASGIDYRFRQFFKEYGIDVSKTKPVMSNGGSEAVALVSGGHVKVGGSTPSAILPAFKAGMVRPLGITGKKKSPDFPDLPTFEEQGSAVRYEQWMGVSGPPKLPSYIVDLWEKALEEMLKDPDILAKMKNIGVTPEYISSNSVRQLVLEEIKQAKELWDIK